MSSACIYADDVNSFVLNGPGCALSDLNTGCNNTTTGYTNRYPAVGMQGLAQGQTYTGSITSSYSSNEYFQIWIDFDKDGAFNNSLHSATNPTGEQMFVSPRGTFGSSTGAYPFTFNIAATAATGQTRMRVFVHYGNSSYPNNACGTSYTEGEAHDYLMNVFALTPCIGISARPTLSPSGTTSGFCPGTSYTINVSNASAYMYSGIFYQWMYSINGGTTWLAVPGAGNASSLNTGPITRSTMFHVVVACANGGIDSSLNTTFTPISGFPQYASLPYFESFESWTNGCSTSDLPSNNWTS
jgi:hypothetical protein